MTRRRSHPFDQSTADRVWRVYERHGCLCCINERKCAWQVMQLIRGHAILRFDIPDALRNVTAFAHARTMYADLIDTSPPRRSHVAITRTVGQTVTRQPKETRTCDRRAKRRSKLPSNANLRFPDNGKSWSETFATRGFVFTLLLFFEYSWYLLW